MLYVFYFIYFFIRLSNSRKSDHNLICGKKLIRSFILNSYRFIIRDSNRIESKEKERTKSIDVYLVLGRHRIIE